MSHDQKPARMRLVAGDSKTQPDRRTADTPVADAENDAISADAAAPAGKTGGMMLGAIVFLFAAAIGGALQILAPAP